MAERVQMSPQEAKEKVAALRRIVLETYELSIKNQPFFVELRAGTLPRAKLKGWVTNWYAFALEVNTGMTTAYHQLVGFFKRHPECEDLIAQEIGEEFTTPAIGSHARMLPVLGKALGVEAHEMIEAHRRAAQVLSRARGSGPRRAQQYQSTHSAKGPRRRLRQRTRRLAAGILRARCRGDGGAVLRRRVPAVLEYFGVRLSCFASLAPNFFLSKFTLSRSTGVFDSNAIKSLELADACHSEEPCDEEPDFQLWRSYNLR